MKFLKKYNIIKESLSYDIAIHFSLENREDAFKIEKELQDRGYRWHEDGTKNVLSWFFRADLDDGVTIFLSKYRKQLVGINGPNNSYNVDIFLNYSKDKNDIMRIIGIKPSYKPTGKFKRIGESNEYYPYRFKTENELIEQYGEEWEEFFGEYGWNYDMNKLFGKDFPFKEYELDFKSINPFGQDDRTYHDENLNSSYFIHWNMLTKNDPPKPSYKPKPISRINESKKRFDVAIYFDMKHKNDVLKLENELQENGYGWHNIGEKDILYPYIEPANRYPGVTLFINIKNKNLYGFFKKINIYDVDIFLEYPKDINKLYKIIGLKPSYKPMGELKRIGESKNNKFKKTLKLYESKHNIIFVYTNNRDNTLKMEHYLHSVGYVWEESPKFIIRDIHKSIEDLTYEINLDNKTLLGETGYKKYIGRDFYIYPEDFYKIKTLLIYGEKRPDYKPKPITRIDESDKWYPYRFKTEEEFIKEFGEEWNDDIQYGWDEGMNYLFGEDYPHNVNPDININNLIDIDGWRISWDMLIKNKPIEPPKPSYKPKPIKRTYESNKQYPYRFKTEEEFIEEFGKDWDSVVNWNDKGDMDYLFGQVFPYSEDQLINTNRKRNYDDVLQGAMPCKYNRYNDGWVISWDMLTKNKPKKPSYKPKPISRIDESDKWYPYRFKTEKEFIKEYGEDWYNFAFWNDKGDMDYLFGQVFPYSEDQLINTNRKISYDDVLQGAMPCKYTGDNWRIFWSMLTENPKKPSYKPKKIIKNY